VKNVKVLREGIREAEIDELLAWQNIVDITLEYEVANLNRVLMSLCEQFNGFIATKIRYFN
jgi:hypothetical protein